MDYLENMWVDSKNFYIAMVFLRIIESLREDFYGNILNISQQFYLLAEHYVKVRVLVKQPQ